MAKIWLSQMIGLECDRPGMLVFQRTFCDFSTSHVVGGFVPSATPEAFGPRNEGQFWALIVVGKIKRTKISRDLILLTTDQERISFSASSPPTLSRASESLLQHLV